jgi:hypothetical protein
MSEVISNLFVNLDKVKESIAIYFNRVPKDKIKNMPREINSKITNLTEI